MSFQRIFLALISAAGIVATFLPWYTTSSGLSVTGVGGTGEIGDGWVTLGLFALALISGVVGNIKEPIEKTKFACAVAGTVNAAIGVLNVTNIYNAYDNISGYSVTIGIGLYLLMAMGVGLCVISFISFKKKPKREKETKLQRDLRKKDERENRY
jgi:hypothetical protein